MVSTTCFGFGFGFYFYFCFCCGEAGRLRPLLAGVFGRDVVGR
jgi:hypothetical protein